MATAIKLARTTWLTLIVLLALSTQVQAAWSAPRLYSYSPTPTASAAPQVVTVSGSNFHQGMRTFGSDGRQLGTATVTGASHFTWTVTLPTTGYVSLTVRNTDGRTSNAMIITVQGAQPPPQPPPLGPIVCPAPQAVTSLTATAVTLVQPTGLNSGGVAPYTLASDPLSGSTFQLGTTPVTWTEKDSIGQQVQCGTSVTVSTPQPPSTATIVAVMIAGPSSVMVNSTTQFKATATLSDGTNQDITIVSAWHSYNSNGHFPTSNGQYLATAVGNGQIEAISANSVAAPLFNFTITSVPVPPVTTCTDPAALNGPVAVPPNGGPLPCIYPIPPPVTGGLVQPTNLVLKGSFRVPGGQFGAGTYDTFEYGGTSIGFNPAKNSLFMVGHPYSGDKVAEISIPVPVLSTDINALPTATVIQNFTDVTNGTMGSIGSCGNGCNIGGTLPFNGRLIASAYVYYDANGSQVKSHWSSPLTFPVTSTIGPAQVQSPGSAGFVSGYMGLVPSSVQSLFGGPAVTGNCCLSIISRTSWGPALFGFDPTQLSPTTVTPDVPLVYYTAANPLMAPGETGDGWSSTSPWFNGSTEVKGVVIPVGTKSVLFFGDHGIGRYCYGVPTYDKSLDGTYSPDGTEYCYDLEGSNKGNHAYPYQYQVWAYSTDDIAMVRSGAKKPWEIKPYAVWALPLPFKQVGMETHILGAAYDPATNRIFVSQAYADGDNAKQPIVHVFSIAGL